jgi:hypothetical protein
MCPALRLRFFPDVIEIRTMRAVATAFRTGSLFYDLRVSLVFGHPKDVFAWSWLNRGIGLLLKLEEFLGVNDRVAEFLGSELGKVFCQSVRYPFRRSRFV